jgi:hypothetical protein
MDFNISLPTWQLLLFSLFGYMIFCRILRFQRQNEKFAQYPYKTRESFSKMTAQHAYEIQQDLFAMEFPFTAATALEFALFK